MKPKFDRKLFDLTPLPSENAPFRLLYAGRIVRSKGVFDLLEIVKEIERKRPGSVKLTICGVGPELELLRRRSEELQLVDLVEIKGEVEAAALRACLVKCHAAIIPTRSGFAEGLAMSAIEPVLLGRPIITNPVVPALESLHEAAVVAKTDDIDSYVNGILSLVDSPVAYQRLASACERVREVFFDPTSSFQSTLEKVIPR